MKHKGRTEDPSIYKSQLADEIGLGAWIEVICIKKPVSGGNTHRGEWEVDVLNAVDGNEPHRSKLVLAGKNTARTFVTVAGLQRLADSLGLSPFIVPTEEDQTVDWIFETSKKPVGSDGCNCCICAAHRKRCTVRN